MPWRPVIAVLIATDELTKRYGQFVALDRCSLGIGRGEIFGLLGPNGAGKTTLLRLLLGFLRPTSGSARIDGLDCYRQATAVHRLVAYLPGEARPFRTMRGREVLRFFARVRGGDLLERARAMAARLDLDLERRVSAMSTGTRQKLALVAALAAPTPIVILDEPTANLDPTVRSDVVRLVREARAAGRTIVFSSHILDEVEATCDRVAILRAGRVERLQVMDELRSRHRVLLQLARDEVPLPPAIGDALVTRTGPRSATIDTPGELSPLLGYLAALPLADVQIERFGLRTIYEQVHPPLALGEGA